MVCISGRFKLVLRPLGILLLLIAFSAVNGCTGTSLSDLHLSNLFAKKKPTTIDKTAEQLALSGMAKIEKKEYGKAAEDFKKLKEHYPYSKYAILADLKLGDAYFYDQKIQRSSVRVRGIRTSSSPQRSDPLCSLPAWDEPLPDFQHQLTGTLERPKRQYSPLRR